MELTAEVAPAQAPEGSTPPPTARKGDSLFRNLVYMTMSSGFIHAGGFVFSILLRRLLTPELIGVWNLLDIVKTYLLSATIGVSYSADRLIPYCEGRGRFLVAGRIRDSLWSWSVFESVLLGGGVLLYALLLGDRHEAPLRLGLYFLPVLFLAQKLLTVYLILLRGTRRFRTYSIGIALSALLDWSLLVWVLFDGLRGLFIGASVVGLLKVLFFRRIARGEATLAVHWRLRWRDLRLHFPYAPRYAVFKAVWTISERLDSLLVAFLLGESALAFYYLGFQLSRVVLELPVALAYIAFPNMMGTYEEGNSRPFTVQFLHYLRINLFLLVPLILPLGYYGSELLIRWVLPSFAPGIPAVKITMMIVPLLAVRHLYYQVLMGHQKIGRLTLVTLVYLPAFVGFYFLLQGAVVDVLARVAYANLAAYFVNMLVVVLMTRPYLNLTKAEWPWKGGLPLLACLFLMILPVLVEQIVPGGAGRALLEDVGWSVVQVLAYSLFVFPMVVAGLGRHRGTYVAQLVARIKRK